MSGRILIRFVVEQPRPQRDPKTGKPDGTTPRIDVDRMLDSIRQQITPLIAARWPDVDVRVVEARVNEIRIEGQWTEKADIVRVWVRDCLNEVMDAFEAEPYVHTPA